MGVAEVDVGIRRDFRSLVAPHFSALVTRQGLAQLVREGAYPGDQVVPDGFETVHAGRGVDQDQESGRALDDAVLAVLAVLAYDGSLFHCPENGPFFNLGGTVSDHHHVRDPALALIAATRPDSGGQPLDRGYGVVITTAVGHLT